MKTKIITRLTARSTFTLTLSILSGFALADPLVLSNTFANGQVADAGEINTNFSEVVAESDENDARITQIEQDYEVDVANGNTVLADGFPNPITSIEGYADPVGSENTALGVSALLTNQAGSSNTAVGFRALTSADAIVDTFESESGSYTNVYGAQGNSALGANALAANTAGNLNTAIGINALKNAAGNTDSHTAVGAWAMENMTGGYANSALGYRAMYASSSSGDGDINLSNNVAVGAFAMNFIQGGAANVGVGVSALSGYNTGSNNTATGYRALTNNREGTNNTAIGANAMTANNSGGGNTAVGDAALTTVTTGTNNTALGHLANVASGALTNATAIGYQAQASDNNEVRLGNGDVVEVITAGTLTAGAITYPNTDGNTDQVLVTNGAGVAYWTDVALLPGIAAREQALWDRIAQLETTLATQQQEMLAVIARQQEQLDQI